MPRTLPLVLSAPLVFPSSSHMPIPKLLFTVRRSLPPIIFFRRPLNHAHDFVPSPIYDGLIINKEDFFMTQEDEVLKNAAATAEFRFGLIAPVIQGLFPDASATAYYKRIAQKEFTLPDGTVKKFSYKTIEDWTTRYKDRKSVV